MKPKKITIQRLLNDELIKALPALYATEDVPLEDKLIVCRFHMIDQPNGWSWYVFEGELLEAYEREPDGCLVENDYRFFGIVHGFEKEMGYFLLSELTCLRHPHAGDLVVKIDPNIFLEPYSQFKHLD